MGCRTGGLAGQWGSPRPRSATAWTCCCPSWPPSGTASPTGGSSPPLKTCANGLGRWPQPARRSWSTGSAPGCSGPPAGSTRRSCTTPSGTPIPPRGWRCRPSGATCCGATVAGRAAATSRSSSSWRGWARCWTPPAWRACWTGGFGAWPRPVRTGTRRSGTAGPKTGSATRSGRSTACRRGCARWWSRRSGIWPTRGRCVAGGGCCTGSGTSTGPPASSFAWAGGCTGSPHEGARSITDTLNEPSCQLVALLARGLEAGPALLEVASRSRRELTDVVLALADDLRDLRIPVVEHVVQQQHRALLRREALQQHQHRQRQPVGCLRVPGRIIAAVGDDRLRQPLAHVFLATDARGAQLVDRQPGGHGRHERARRCDLLAGLQRLMHPQQRFLHHVLGLGDAAQHPVGDRERDRPQLVKQSLAIAHAAANPCRQLGCLGCHPSSRLALALEAPRSSVISTAPTSPAASRGACIGCSAPSIRASAGSHSATGAGSSSTTL